MRGWRSRIAAIASRSAARRMPPVGIVRRVQDHQARLRRDRRLELRRVEREIARFAKEHRHRHRAVGDDLRLVDREARHRVDHLVADAVVGHRRDRVGDERLRAGADDHVVGGDRQPAPRTHVTRRRGAQLVDARRRRVAVLPAAYRRDRRVLHVRRCREIRLADAERHDVLAGAHQRVDLGQHDEGVLGAERLGATRQRRHDRLRGVGGVHRRSPRARRAAYRSRNVRPAGAGMSRPAVQPAPSGRRRIIRWRPPSRRSTRAPMRAPAA